LISATVSRSSDLSGSAGVHELSDACCAETVAANAFLDPARACSGLYEFPDAARIHVFEFKSLWVLFQLDASFVFSKCRKERSGGRSAKA
jgi:hypothetical protein